MERPCGPRRSSRNPDAYSKPELVELVSSMLDMKTSVASRLTVEQLCGLLKNYQSSIRRTRVVSRKSSKKVKDIPRNLIVRPCGPRRSKKYPNAYSKDELVELAVSNNIMDEKNAKRLKIDELCKILRGESGVLECKDIPEEKAPKRNSTLLNDKDKLVALISKILQIPEDRLQRLGLDKLKLFLSQDVSLRSTAPSGRVSEPSKKSDEKMDLSCITASQIPLRDYQKIVVKHMLSNRGILAIHSTGAGKTLTAVTATQCYLQNSPKGKVYVITPKSLQDNFMKELERYGVKNLKRYELYTIHGFINASRDKKIKCNKCMIVIDESHNLRTQIKAGGEDKKGRKIKATGSGALEILKQSKNAERILLLTATPVVNYPDDLNNLVSMIKGVNPLTSKEFNTILESPLLFNKYFGCIVSMYSPTQEEVKHLYPSYEVEDVFIPMENKYLEDYKKVESNLLPDCLYDFWDINRNSEKLPNLKVFYNGLRRASNGLDEKKSQKINWIIQHIDSSSPEDKYVVFSHFLRAGSRLLIKRLKELNIPYGYIDGTLSRSSRQEVVEKYNQDRIKVLIISKAGGEGLDLKATRNIIIMEPSWNEATIRQIIGRGIRVGSHFGLPVNKQNVKVYKLYLIKPSERSYLNKILKNLLIIPRPDDNFEDNIISVDLVLRNFSLRKELVNQAFLEKLKSVSIENRPC
jgi:SNF2 family DNA or RNA helicase